MELTEQDCTYDAIMHVAVNAREIDKIEALAFGADTVFDAIADSHELSLVSWSGSIDGEPFVVAGVVPSDIETMTGTPWMIATPRIAECSIAFARYSKRATQVMMATFDRLENHVHAENVDTIKWLNWLGFTVTDEVSEFSGHPFVRFYWEKQ